MNAAEITELLGSKSSMETAPTAAGLFAMVEPDVSGGWIYGEWRLGGRLHVETFTTIGETVQRMTKYAPIEAWNPFRLG